MIMELDEHKESVTLVKLAIDPSRKPVLVVI